MTLSANKQSATVRRGHNRGPAAQKFVSPSGNSVLVSMIVSSEIP